MRIRVLTSLWNSTSTFPWHPKEKSEERVKKFVVLLLLLFRCLDVNIAPFWGHHGQHPPLPCLPPPAYTTSTHFSLSLFQKTWSVWNQICKTLYQTWVNNLTRYCYSRITRKLGSIRGWILCRILVRYLSTVGIRNPDMSGFRMVRSRSVVKCLSKTGHFG